MENFVIITDTGCDLSKDLRERFGIADILHGVLYCPDGSEKRADLDWTEMTADAFFSSMNSKKNIYRTSAPTLGETEEVFEKYLKEGKDILSVSLCSSLSCTYENCVNVAKALTEKYPERKIVCVDSLRYSTALALLLAMAAQKKNAGATLEETAAYIEAIKHNVHQMGFMDDLFFLCRTGRISNVKAFFGSLVGVNPLADFNRKGLSEVLGKAKGKKTAIEKTVTYIEKTIINPEEQIIFVAHSNRLPYAELLAQRIQEKFNPKEIVLTDVGMACGASIGPGLCAAFYYGAPISESGETEKALMEEILAK